MKRIVLSVLSILLIGMTASAQANFKRTSLDPIPLSNTVTVSELGAGFDERMDYLEAPMPSGNSYREFLELQKEKVSAEFPRQNNNVQNRGGNAEAP